jgi:hypothetical protein
MKRFLFPEGTADTTRCGILYAAIEAATGIHGEIAQVYQEQYLASVAKHIKAGRMNPDAIAINASRQAFNATIGRFTIEQNRLLYERLRAAQNRVHSAVQLAIQDIADRVQAPHLQVLRSYGVSTRSEPLEACTGTNS